MLCVLAIGLRMDNVDVPMCNGEDHVGSYEVKVNPSREILGWKALQTNI